MDRKQALELISKHFSEIQKFKVKSIGIFGSVARNEATADSDVDVLVEFSEPIGLFEFARLQHYLEKLLGRRVDLVAKNAIKLQLRGRILKEMVHAA